MTYHLLNSAMMPMEGVYTLKAITPGQFAGYVRQADKEKWLKSYVGYPQNKRVIKELSGKDMDKNRGAQGNIQEHTGGSVMKPPDNTPTLSDIGISKTQSHRFQTMAELPVDVPLSREQTFLKSGDVLLVMRLKYRVGGEHQKGDEVSAGDFEYFWCDYSRE